MSIGYYSSKKTDDICEEVCGQQSSRAALSMSRLKCILRGLDLKTYIILLVLVPLGILGLMAYLNHCSLQEIGTDSNFIENRLTYGMVGGRFRKGENPFVEEAYQRVALDQLIRIAGIEDDDLLLMSDVDEIPSAHTINLLRWCNDTPPVLHLQLKNYLYSFEYFVDNESWRASVHKFRTGKTRYAHYRQADVLLSDAGWHCSFCFRHISEFVFKMKAYSHYDRVRFSHYLNPERIQNVICKGD
ncbi:BETA-14-N-ACETYLGLUCOSAMINYLTRANSFERASE FAMILY PROTEIN [Salix purpurea]|uniref:BETA-14-N-ACETYLGLUCOSAMINYLTRANSFERASE FAMILY PROTEIN n=1 Tax=Salix purpurea TaxID=77065 RepID=A0A9Q0VV84_SALPP|nr:BETA-14-N-ACETYLGLUCOSAMINYLTRANSFERASE FAMILY PROTEIN [Salix purpurea]